MCAVAGAGVSVSVSVSVLMLPGEMAIASYANFSLKPFN